MTLSHFLRFWLPKRKKIIILGLVLVLLGGILIPTHFALAQWWNPLSWITTGLSSAAKAVTNGLLVVIFGLLNAVAVTFLELSQIIFQWVTSPGFIGVSYTGPDNFIVQEGWMMLRNLANSGLLLGLVYVGLATAFNVAGYNTKKILLRLLVAALLINFTPIFCGAIIDGSNILSNYFLSSSPTIRQGWGTTFSQQFSDLAGNLLANPGIVLAKALMLLIFNLVSTFVFLIFAALFAFRYAVLWLLVILSPLAFLAWALGEAVSAAKKLFEQWLHNFLSWSFIAVPAGFVIYLADHLMSFAQGNQLVGKSTDLEEMSEGFAAAITTYGIPMIFLIVGFLFTLSTSAQGSSLVISSAKKIGKKGGKAALKGGKALGRRTSQTAARGVAGAAAGTKEARQQATTRWQKFTAPIRGGIPGAFKEGAIEKGTEQAEEWATRKGKTPFGYAQRAIGRTVLKAGVKSEQGAYEAKRKKAEQFDLQTNASRYQSADQIGKLAIASQAMKEEEFDELIKKADIQAGEAESLYQSAIHLRDDKAQKGIERQFAADIGEELGNIAQESGKYTSEQKEKDRLEKGYTTYVDKIVDEAKGQNAIKQLSASLGMNKTHSGAVNQAIHKFWGGSQIEKAAEAAGSKFTQGFRQSAPKVDWYLEVDNNTGQVRNVDGAFYRAGTVAQRSGVGFTEDVTMKDLKTKFAEKQKLSEEILSVRRMGENARRKQAEQEKSTPEEKTKPRKRRFNYRKEH